MLLIFFYCLCNRSVIGGLRTVPSTAPSYVQVDSHYDVEQREAIQRTASTWYEYLVAS
jgi:hypothetical protein